MFSFDHPESEYCSETYVGGMADGWKTALLTFGSKAFNSEKKTRKWKTEIEKELERDKVKWSKNIKGQLQQSSDDNRDLKQTDVVAERRWSTSKFLFRRTRRPSEFSQPLTSMALNLPMAGGGGGELNRLILETSVHEKIFQIGPTVLALKLDKGRVLGGGNHPATEQKLTYFSNHEDDIQS